MDHGHGLGTAVEAWRGHGDDEGEEGYCFGVALDYYYQVGEVNYVGSFA